MAMAKEKAFWKERINGFIGLAPGLPPSKPVKEYGSESSLGNNIGDNLWNFGFYELFGDNWRALQAKVIDFLPALEPKIRAIYSNSKYNSQDGTTVFGGHFPNGVSVQNLKHFGQILAKGYWCEFDYHNEELNAAAYESGRPERVDLAGMTSENSAPIFFITSRNDTVVFESQIDRFT